MVTGLIGKKVGMTQLFTQDGVVHPATVLKAGPCVVSQVKTVDHDGYEAVQLGLVEARPHNENKPTEGHFKKAGVPTRVRREVSPQGGRRSGKGGHQVKVSMFADGERVGRHWDQTRQGFPGRCQASPLQGRPHVHGSMFHRAPGSDRRLVVPSLS